MAAKQEQTKGVEVVVRECDHMVTILGNHKSLKWQAHAYLTGKFMQEPIISGHPERTQEKAMESLEEALTEYIDLGIKAKDIIFHQRKQKEAIAKRNSINKKNKKKNGSKGNFKEVHPDEGRTEAERGTVEN